MQVATPKVGAEKATTPRGNTTGSCSTRLADKFVVRLPDGMRQRVDEHASTAHTSMNTFIVQAIEDKLDADRRQRLLLDALALAVKARSGASA